MVSFLGARLTAPRVLCPANKGDVRGRKMLARKFRKTKIVFTSEPLRLPPNQGPYLSSANAVSWHGDPGRRFRRPRRKVLRSRSRKFALIFLPESGVPTPLPSSRAPDRKNLRTCTPSNGPISAPQHPAVEGSLFPQCFGFLIL